MSDSTNLEKPVGRWIDCTLKGVVVMGLAFLSVSNAYAQGCILARTSQPVGREERGGYLSSGQWELTLGYRYLYSNHFFIGSTEQNQIVEAHNGDAVANRINLLNFQANYEINPRWSIGLNVPVLLASRHFPGYLPGYMTGLPGALDQDSGGHGVGDINLTAQSWIWDPSAHSRGNIAVGFGVALPTGDDNYQDVVQTKSGTQKIPVDSSIQPGFGGWGIVLQSQGFRAIKRAVLYYNASYLLEPEDTTNTLSGLPGPLRYNSIPDSYLVEAGVAFPIPKVRGLNLTLGPRIEGVPVHDLLGDSNGFRRPGYAFSLEPGFEYSRGHTIITFGLPIAVERNRQQSVPEQTLGKHGGASFSRSVWLLNYTYRF